jgi:hypothetical protein
MPKYETGKRSVPIADAEIEECPVAYISTQSHFLLSQIGVALGAKDLGGASLFGPNLSEWPAWAVDAFAAVSLAKAERDEALSKN